MRKIFLGAVMLCLLVAVAQAADQSRRIVIYDGVATEVTASAEPTKDLWVTTSDLKRATQFEIKPQGACREGLCFPLPTARKAEFVAKKGAVTWFNLSEFARLTKQPVAVDDKHETWYFGPRSMEVNARLSTLEAPDFTLPDSNGKMHSLADFRVKKVLLLTWASW